jgi:hypothetical protein
LQRVPRPERSSVLGAFGGANKDCADSRSMISVLLSDLKICRVLPVLKEHMFHLTWTERFAFSSTLPQPKPSALQMDRCNGCLLSAYFAAFAFRFLQPNWASLITFSRPLYKRLKQFLHQLLDNQQTKAGFPKIGLVSHTNIQKCSALCKCSSLPATSAPGLCERVPFPFCPTS